LLVVTICTLPSAYYKISESDYFINNVGSVFIETGSVSIQKRLLNFLNTNYKTNKIQEDALLEIYRDFSWPIWDKTNTYFLLLKLNKLNKTLKREDKIQVYAIDEPIPNDTEIKNKEDYLTYENTYLSKNRDSVMAANIIQKFDSIRLYSKRKKCMVITNYRHAFLKNVQKSDTLHSSKGKFPLYSNTEKQIPCTASILANYYSNNIASIYINSMTVGSFEGQAPIQKGKWDASFKILKKDNIGFDFENTPFGIDSLDIWGFSKPEYTYDFSSFENLYGFIWRRNRKKRSERNI